VNERSAARWLGQRFPIGGRLGKYSAADRDELAAGQQCGVPFARDSGGTQIGRSY
jgi:hypothetical protein